jgi:long-chain acyl-CoA synthetase
VGYLGIHLAGGIAAPIDGRAPTALRREVEDRLAPVLVIAEQKLAEFRSFAQRPVEGPDHPPQEAPSEGDVADILFTTGSTGRPKGVVLTHRNIVSATANIVAFIGSGPEDREVVTLPLSHSFGLGRLRCTLTTGATLILAPGLTFPAVTFDLLSRYRATGPACVPTGVALLLKWGRSRLAEAGETLRYVEIGSAPMPLSTKRELMELLPGTRICMHYGLTEASRSTFLEFHADAAHLESIGKPSPNVAIRIRSDAGEACPTGRTGRLQVRSETVMKEYWRDPEGTRRVCLEDGWLDTGDLGHVDEAGYVHLDARSEDVINVGGKKVYPATVEGAAAEFPGVLESACIGVPDPRGLTGDTPVLYVVESAPGSLDPHALLAHLAARLESHAVPSALRLASSLPKTSSGKLLRSALREAAPQTKE